MGKEFDVFEERFPAAVDETVDFFFYLIGVGAEELCYIEGLGLVERREGGGGGSGNGLFLLGADCGTGFVKGDEEAPFF